MMRGHKFLQLLTVFVHLARCQQKPEVSMSPELKEIFSGDLFYLSCDNSASTVKWYFNDIEQLQLTGKTWKFAVASPAHSGSYQCESNGQRSNKFFIDVLEYSPAASLTIKTGHPVMQNGHAVILQLDNEEGLHGWWCRVYRRANKQRRSFRFKMRSNTTAIIQTTKITAPETIFWCADINHDSDRSNQIIVRTSDKDIALEMYPLPAVLGESLTLRCLVWGTDQISNAVFYKDNVILSEPVSTLVINKVTDVTQGRYKCEVTYTHKARISGPPYHKTSDTQDVLVQVPRVKAVLSADGGLSCSCPRCHRNISYQWFFKNDGLPWKSMAGTSDQMTPNASGNYACRAVWNNRKSLLSDTYIYESRPNLLTFFFIFLAILTGVLTSITVAYKCYKKSHSSGPIYEDFALKSRNDDERYETLQKDGRREDEYDKLNKGTEGRERREGYYQPLQKGGMKEGVYHTLGPEGATGGQGGYEALKKEGMEEGVYHTLGTEGATGGQGGYEALKKEGMKEGVYHTLGTEGATGGQGGYEALKKEGMKEGVYHTLETEGATGGQGGYEALKKEGMKGGVYHTLGTERQQEDREGMKH